MGALCFLYSGQRSNVHILADRIPGKCSVLYSAHAGRNVSDGLCAAVKLFSQNLVLYSQKL